jgi:hypothetical protein
VPEPEAGTSATKPDSKPASGSCAVVVAAQDLISLLSLSLTELSDVFGK